MKINNIFFDTLYRYSSIYSKKVAVIDENTNLTYEMLWQEIQNKRNFLYNKNFQKNTIVILNLENNSVWISYFLSLLSLGCIVVPVSSKISFYELKKVASHFPNYNIIDESFILENTKMLETSKVDNINIDYPSVDQIAIYHMTSGTTGIYKLCVRTLKNLIAESDSFKKTLGLVSEDKILNPLPLSHSYALGFACISVLMSGAQLILMKKYTPRALLGNIERYGVTISLAVPSIINDLSNLYTDKRYDLGSLKFIMSGAGSLNESNVNHVKSKYKINVFSNYGSTETGAIACGLNDRLPGSVGKPMYGVLIKILGVTNKELGPNEVGRIYVKNLGAMKGYYKGCDTEVFNMDKYFFMGDLGYKDCNNNLFVTGREKLLINIGGKKVNPKEIEDTLLSMKEISEVHVYSLLKRNGSEIIVADIVKKNVINESQVLKYCKKRLSDYKIPTKIRFLEKILKNEIGKISK